MTQPERLSQPPEGRFTFAMHRIRNVYRYFNDAGTMSCMQEREALIEVELIRGSLTL